MEVKKKRRALVTDVNPHLICVLCQGYFIEATTIVECLHSFCRSCLVKYLENNKFCPICDLQLHKNNPLLSVRIDPTLQKLVYKLIPGLYGNEMTRRKKYYRELGGGGPCSSDTDPDPYPVQHLYFSPNDSISLSLEFVSSESEGDNNDDDPNKPEKQYQLHRRYLQCPAAVNMSHLKKFIRMKYDLNPLLVVDIIYDGECLVDDFSLIDVAYTFNWNRATPMRFQYRIRRKPIVTSTKAKKIVMVKPIMSPRKRGLATAFPQKPEVASRDTSSGIESKRFVADTRVAAPQPEPTSQKEVKVILEKFPIVSEIPKQDHPKPEPPKPEPPKPEPPKSEAPKPEPPKPTTRVPPPSVEKPIDNTFKKPAEKRKSEEQHKESERKRPRNEPAVSDLDESHDADDEDDERISRVDEPIPERKEPSAKKSERKEKKKSKKAKHHHHHHHRHHDKKNSIIPAEATILSKDDDLMKLKVKLTAIKSENSKVTKYSVVEDFQDKKEMKEDKIEKKVEVMKERKERRESQRIELASPEIKKVESTPPPLAPVKKPAQSPARQPQQTAPTTQVQNLKNSVTPKSSTPTKPTTPSRLSKSPSPAPSREVKALSTPSSSPMSASPATTKNPMTSAKPPGLTPVGKTAVPRSPTTYSSNNQVSSGVSKADIAGNDSKSSNIEHALRKTASPQTKQSPVTSSANNPTSMTAKPAQSMPVPSSSVSNIVNRRFPNSSNGVPLKANPPPSSVAAPKVSSPATISTVSKTPVSSANNNNVNNAINNNVKSPVNLNGGSSPRNKNDSVKFITDESAKEKLLQMRAVRKMAPSKCGEQQIKMPPSSITVSKITAEEKRQMEEAKLLASRQAANDESSRPSLEIMLVNGPPAKEESRVAASPQPVQSPQPKSSPTQNIPQTQQPVPKKIVRPPPPSIPLSSLNKGAMARWQAKQAEVLDLSEKSSRKTPPQGSVETTSMRNLVTLSDTAVSLPYQETKVPPLAKPGSFMPPPRCSKPNQNVRQIPNPSALLFRQYNGAIPPHPQMLQPLRKMESMTRNIEKVAAGLKAAYAAK